MYQEPDLQFDLFTTIIMNDFDYIADGGFLIECEDGKKQLGVTGAQAEILKRESDFINNCFRHGTTEAANGHLKKPDWSIAIARHVVEVLTKDITTVSHLELYEELIAAGDQACLDLRLCSFVNYLEPVSKECTDLFSTLVEPSLYKFEFKGQLTSNQWVQLLEKGILMNRKETNYVVRKAKDPLSPRVESFESRKLDNKVSDYRVHTDMTIRSLLAIQQLLAGSEARKPSTREERFSIYFETTQTMPAEHHALIERLAGGDAYIRTCADNSISSEGYTVMGSFDLLRRALQPLNDEILNGVPKLFCSLRIDNPTPDTIGRFINACRQAKDYPNTLGLDSSTNRYFCRKTLRDIRNILDYLADFSTTAEISGDFMIYQLSSEDEPF